MATDGSFSATLTFNGGSPEQVTGNCSGGVITFSRDAASQAFVGSYSNQGMSGTFTFQGDGYFWAVPACNGNFSINANGYLGLLIIPSVASDGSFSGTLTFNGWSPEQIAGTCSAGAITFNRTAGSQMYSGSYSSEGMTGTFTFQGRSYIWSAPPPSCDGIYRFNANGYSGTLAVPSVASDGSFSGTLTFNGWSPEQIAGTCSAGAITFNRSVGAQVYAGNYSNQGITGTLTYLGETYFWNATAPSCNGNYVINASGYSGTLAIPIVASDGSFSGTLTFNGWSPEQIAGTCSAGAITFNRTADSQSYSGNYSSQDLAGTFTYQGLNYFWSATLQTTPPSDIDSRITILMAGDITSRRVALIRHAFQMSALPTTQAVVTVNVRNPFPGFTNLARVDQYVATMTNGQTNSSHLYVAGPVNTNRMVILNPGHQGTCDWTTFNASYRIQSVLQALLNSGFSVFAMNMPGCGYLHDALFQSYGDTAMRYFIEPIVQALNYMDAHYSFTSYDIVGLSGGGWTATIGAALDTRIQISIAVAGSMPGVQFVPGAANSGNHGDAEQNAAGFFSIAGYLDQYVMASYGLNRQHVQILNFSDGCCFGNAQWSYSTFNFQTYFGVDWSTYVSDYAGAIASSQSQIGMMNYGLVIDTVATGHEISTYAESLIESILDR